MDVPAPYALVLLALASYRTTVLLVKDWVPFGGLRERIWRRWPPGDGDRIPATRIGYLFTCQSCAGVWNGAAWWGAWRLWPVGALSIAAAFAIMAVQRTLAVVADAIESVNEDT